MLIALLCTLWWGLVIGPAGAAEVMPEAKHVAPQGIGQQQTAATSHDHLGACWVNAARAHHVNVDVLLAIAEVESGLKPDAMNRNRSGSADLGIMQINSAWLPTLKRYGISRQDLFDPCINIHVGAWILAKNNQRFGATSWRAVGAYNAANENKQLVYAVKVYRRLRR